MIKNIDIIFTRYNDGESIEKLSKEFGYSQKKIMDQLSKFVDQLIHKFRELPKAERLQYNEHQRRLLEKRIAITTPILCVHSEIEQQANGSVWCNVCEKYLKIVK